MEFIELCRKFIATESTPPSGNVAVAKLAGEIASSLGLKVEYQEGVFSGVAHLNVIARTGAPSEDEIILQTHLDTAEPGTYSLWTKTDCNPFNASIRDGRIYGLGAANAKLDFVCKLWAIKELSASSLRKPIVVVGSFGEVSGMAGAKKLVKSGILKGRLAAIGQASGMSLINACNGIAVLDFFLPFSDDEKRYRSEHFETESTSTHSRIFRAKAPQSLAPNAGENAILKAMNYLAELPESVAILTVDGGTFHNIVADQAYVEVDVSQVLVDGSGQRLLKLVRELENLSTDFLRFTDKEITPPHPTLNYGVVRTYEDGIQLIVSLRMTPSVINQDLQNWRGRLREFGSSNNVRFRLRDFKLPWKAAQQSQIVGLARIALDACGLPVRFLSASATNEASVFFQDGFDCIAFGPGEFEGNGVGPNESVSIDDLQKTILFYKTLIERYCL